MVPEEVSRSKGKTTTYDSNFKIVGEISKCQVQMLDQNLEFIIDTGSQISAISETIFKRYFQEHSLLKGNFIKLTAANGVNIPYLGHLICDLKINNAIVLNCIIYVLKKVEEIQEQKLEYGILGTNVLASLPEFQNLVKNKLNSNEQSKVSEQEVYISGKGKYYLPENSMSMIQVRARSGTPAEEEVMFETYKNLEKQNVYFMNTFTTLRKKTCWVCACNLGTAGVFLSLGLPAGKISTATIDWSRYIHQESMNEIRVEQPADVKEEIEISENVQEVGEIHGTEEKKAKVTELLKR